MPLPEPFEPEVEPLEPGSEVLDQDEDEDSEGRRTLKNAQIDLNGATTVRKCNDYMSRVFADDEDKQWQFEEVLLTLEEDF